MCITTHSQYLCKHKGPTHTTQCTPTFTRPVCAEKARASNTLTFCCNIRCCHQAVNAAKDRFMSALEDYEAFRPSTWDCVFGRAKLKEQKAELRGQLIAARKLRDEVEETHHQCWKMQMAVRGLSTRTYMDVLEERMRGDSTGDSRVDSMAPVDGEAMGYEMREMRAAAFADEREASNGVYFPRGAMCSSRPKGKERAMV
ncbi:hypothetical protein M409DRAFT_22783 [Zasmidium cellare ATCC 36951]|uniref:Uncharacterized protein n=1 Tax=Zasmidium cellare ATCC 36951 TaxID=1080233 RepID=A0A6A6CMQ1_ZASCE|nr:uncharacterized protein M409DRAFT_22783 [Zasmidium cellare ATCC 36951]KAF2166726.1 hypothetical protein M409DRAFT_22783 [Zasmidium cellare ATCC 36951]